MDQVGSALLIATVVTAVVDYLKAPLENTPKVRDWLIRKGLAYVMTDSGLVSWNYNETATPTSSSKIVIWPIPYVTFVLGLALSMAFEVDLVSKYITTAGYWPAKILTAIIVAVGAKLIHKLSS